MSDESRIGYCQNSVNTYCETRHRLKIRVFLLERGKEEEILCSVPVLVSYRCIGMCTLQEETGWEAFIMSIRI